MSQACLAPKGQQGAVPAVVSQTTQAVLTGLVAPLQPVVVLEGMQTESG